MLTINTSKKTPQDKRAIARVIQNSLVKKPIRNKIITSEKTKQMTKQLLPNNSMNKTSIIQNNKSVIGLRNTNISSINNALLDNKKYTKNEPPLMTYHGYTNYPTQCTQHSYNTHNSQNTRNTNNNNTCIRNTESNIISNNSRNSKKLINNKAYLVTEPKPHINTSKFKKELKTNNNSYLPNTSMLSQYNNMHITFKQSLNRNDKTENNGYSFKKIRNENTFNSNNNVTYNTNQFLHTQIKSKEQCKEAKQQPVLSYKQQNKINTVAPYLNSLLYQNKI